MANSGRGGQRRVLAEVLDDGGLRRARGLQGALAGPWPQGHDADLALGGARGGTTQAFEQLGGEHAIGAGLAVLGLLGGLGAGVQVQAHVAGQQADAGVIETGELVVQATGVAGVEHDELAQSILLCPDAGYIEQVREAIERLLPELPRRDVIRASLECRFVAKSEIRHWPLVGWLVARQGTVFVVRARRHDTSRVNASLESALKRGERMVVFPEGTTTDGSEVKPFHGSLLQPVVATQGYAMPVAIRYLDTEGRRSDRAACAGDRSLWDSTRLITGESMTVAEIRFLAAVHAVGRHRRDLAQHCAKAVADALELPHP